MTQISILPSGNMLRKLREELVLLLDENLCAELNKHHLHYDRKTGLSSRKEDKEK